MYTWRRNGQLLNKTDGVDYYIENSLTFAYCDIVAGTVDMLTEMNITVKDSDDGPVIVRNKFRCISSVLTIYKVTVTDLGKYQCGIHRESEYPIGNNITVFNDTSEDTNPPRIAYFQKARDRGLLTKILFQCVVENGPVHWYLQLLEDGQSPQTIQEISVANFWRCFNFRSKSHTVGNITESFAYFDHVCRNDKIQVYCGADFQKQIISQADELYSPTDFKEIPGVYNDNPEHYHKWISQEALNVHMGLVIPTIVILFSALAAMLACCRGGMCTNCCDNFCCSGGGGQYYSQVPVINFVAAENTIRPSG